MANKHLRNARRRPHTRPGKVHNWAGTSAVFLVVMSLAFLRYKLDEWLVGSLAVLFVLLLYLAKRYEYRRSMQHVDKMSGHDFEMYLVKVFRASGYKTELVGNEGADFGADLIAEKGNVRFAVQAKNYDRNVHKVGNDAVQQAIAGATYYDCQEAMVVTNAHFTKAAKEQALASNIIPVTLIERAQLKRMMKHL